MVLKTVLSGTPIVLALVRSTSTNTCGKLALNVVLAFSMSGCKGALATMSWLKDCTISRPTPLEMIHGMVGIAAVLGPFPIEPGPGQANRHIGDADIDLECIVEGHDRDALARQGRCRGLAQPVGERIAGPEGQRRHGDMDESAHQPPPPADPPMMASMPAARLRAMAGVALSSTMAENSARAAEISPAR